jgi:hypothetical protein
MSIIGLKECGDGSRSKRDQWKKLFKIGRFNLKGKLKEWFKKMGIVPTNWQTMKTTMLLKYGTEDKEEIIIKLDLIKQ